VEAAGLDALANVEKPYDSTRLAKINVANIFMWIKTNLVITFGCTMEMELLSVIVVVVPAS
jgi:hypothetical protein